MLQEFSNCKSNFRSHGQTPQGTIIKGVIQKPYRKLVCSSIPSRYDQVVFKQESQSGFSSTSSRFSEQKTQFTGPQQYDESDIFKKTYQKVFSKQGLGNGFSSKVERQIFQNLIPNSGPGPGQYEFQKIQEQNNEKHLLLKLKKKQKKTIEKPLAYQMGPGDYNLNYKDTRNNTLASAFLSKYQRDEYRRTQVTPAPGQYESPEYIVQNKRYHTGLNWEFKQKDQKIEKRKQDLQLAMDKYIQNIQKNAVESTQDEIEEKVITQKNQTWVFRQGLKDRFGDKQPITNDQNLGPGFYEADKVTSLEFKNKEINFVSSSAFMSLTERQPYQNAENKLGPNLIQSNHPEKKKNVHLNLDNLWVS